MGGLMICHVGSFFDPSCREGACLLALPFHALDKEVMHFAVTFVRALPPLSSGFCSVDSGTLKIAPFHIK